MIVIQSFLFFKQAGVTPFRSSRPIGIRALSHGSNALVTPKLARAPSKLTKKPSRPPFLKNIFRGVYDEEMLIYPEFDKATVEEVKLKIQPHKDYFISSVHSETISTLKMIPNEVMENLKNLGLFGQIIPYEFGGCNQTATETALISEITAKDLDIALTLYSHNFLGAQSLVMFGNCQQKDKYLTKLATGEWISSFCMSEKSGSSDLASIQVTVTPDCNNPGMFVLNGSKQWAINGSNAKIFIVVAKSELRTHTGDTCPSVRLCLIDKDSPGVTVSQPQEHLGLNASNITEVHFKDTPVTIECFIGNENQGFEICSKLLNCARYNIGALTTSVLKNVLHKASDFILKRKHSEKPLIDCEYIQHKFSEVSTAIYVLESMTYHTAAILDIYEDPDCSLELAAIKVFSFTEGRRCLDLIMELLGGHAYLSSEIVQKYVRDFRTMEVFDGTIDIANLFISLIGLQFAGETLQDSVTKMRFPYEYPTFILKRVFTQRKHYNDDPKLNLHLFEQLHPSLTDAANDLEYCVLRLEYAVSCFFGRYGGDVINQQIDLMRLADVAVKIYAMTAVLGRASRSYCIGLHNAHTEVKYAIRICSMYKRHVQTELNDLINGIVLSGDAHVLKDGPNIIRHHGYFLEHPLKRSY